MRKRVICALSGGVDSSVAAALLKREGYDVIGVFMKLWSPSAEATGDKAENICCSLEAATAARAVAAKLKIPFYILNLEKEFKKAVVDYYIKEYEAGRTPNPCVICNRDIKGEILMQKAIDLDADYLATGHYARIEEKRISTKYEVRRKYKLLQAKDKNKDQSYFLWTLTQEKLARLLFPVGGMTKPEVRAMAAKLELPTAERRESQGICFIPDRDVCGFLRRHAKKLTKPGPIVDTTGKNLGLHDGLINYTIGQRERLGLGGPRAYYVVKLNSQENILVVGDEEDLYQRSLIVRDLNWINKQLACRQGRPTTGIKATIRYGHPATTCKLENISFGKIKVTFFKPQRAVTPGQSIVFYLPAEASAKAGQGDAVLGGGVIE